MESMVTAELEVLEFLKKELELVRNLNGSLSFYAVNIKDLIKFIEHPEKCGNWPFDFVYTVMEAIKKIKKNYIIPNPIKENQTKEDIV